MQRDLHECPRIALWARADEPTEFILESAPTTSIKCFSDPPRTAQEDRCE